MRLSLRAQDGTRLLILSSGSDCVPEKLKRLKCHCFSPQSLGDTEKTSVLPLCLQGSVVKGYLWEPLSFELPYFNYGSAKVLGAGNFFRALSHPAAASDIFSVRLINFLCD